MSLLDNLTGLLSQYSGGAAPVGDPEAHFQQVLDRSMPERSHPTLVKTLGSAAMMIAMRKIAERRA